MHLCSVCHNKKMIYIKEQELIGLLSSLGTKVALTKFL